MPAPTDFPAHGKVISIDGSKLVFIPSNTSYQLQLEGTYSGALNTPIQAYVRCVARKVLTAPSGGNFVEPIFGRPRTIQGRVRYADNKEIVIQAGVPIIVELPTNDINIDLDDGPITVGNTVNIMVFPGARFELAREPAIG